MQAGSNTISTFTIDSNNPTSLQMLGAPVSSGGEFPVSLAFNAAGDRMCVLNGGAVAGVNCFSVDGALGLTAIPGSLRALALNQTTPPAGPAGTASHVLFSADGSRLLASVKGAPPTPGFLAVWQVAADGALSETPQMIAPPQGGLLPFGMSLVPGKDAVLATDPGAGFDIIDFGAAGKEQNSVAAGNSSVVKVDGQTAVCWSSHSAKTGNFYLTDIGTSLVTEVNVDDSLKASIVKVSCLIFWVHVCSIGLCLYSNTSRRTAPQPSIRTSPRLATTST